MAKTTKSVWAAGGVLWRPGADGGTEIAVVHRPRYDDWTHPKGKTEPGETMVATAVREISEETGYDVRLGRHLRDVAYTLNKTTRKRVRYWTAQAVAGEFVVNREVDELVWLDPARAERRLSHRLDRAILHEFNRLPADLHTVLLVRHAKAGRRSAYRGDDRGRPLDRQGRHQAEALVDVLASFGASSVRAADRVRCEQTLEPLSAALSTTLQVEPTLSEEAYSADPKAAHRRILEIAKDQSTITAVCSQGKVIPPLLDWWARRDDITLPAARNRKASVWVLTVAGRHLMAADHIDSPLPPEH